jgi:hypothetical protein
MLLRPWIARTPDAGVAAMPRCRTPIIIADLRVCITGEKRPGISTVLAPSCAYYYDMPQQYGSMIRAR